MPYLTFNKEEKNKAIAVLKKGDGTSKVVYISDAEPTEKNNIELEYSDIDKRIKGNKTKEKMKVFEMIQKGLSKGVELEHLLTDDDNVKRIYKDILDESGRIIKVGHDCHFEPLPVVPDDKGSGRECIYLTGCSGSGKSYWAKMYCENYNKLFKGKRPIYLISQLEEDDTLDNSACTINRIKLDTLCDDPIDLNTGEMTDCLIIFDDFDTIENTPTKKYHDAVWKLLNDVLITGRHYNISVLVISHYNTNGKKGRLILTESSRYVVYPHGTSAYALKYLLGHHVGIDTKEIAELGKLGRVSCLSKTYPKYLISEHVIKLI